MENNLKKSGFTVIPQDQLKDMRFVSNTTGEIFEAQLEQLKKLAYIVFDGSVQVSINKDSQEVFTEVPHQPTNATSKWPEIVQEILGQKWAVNLSYAPAVKVKNVKRTSKNTRKRRTNSRGKKQSGNVRRVKRR